MTAETTTATQAPVIEAHFGLFGDTPNRRWAATVDGELLTYRDGMGGHSHVRTFATEAAALRAAEAATRPDYHALAAACGEEA